MSNPYRVLSSFYFGSVPVLINLASPSLFISLLPDAAAYFILLNGIVYLVLFFLSLVGDAFCFEDEFLLNELPVRFAPPITFIF